MSDNFFRRRPYLDRGIDTWKILVLAVIFLVLIGWLAYNYWG